MDKVNGRLTVYFEEPFWVGIFEHIEDGKLSVAKVTFGVEPKDYEVREQVETLMEQMTEKQGVTEELKAQDQMEWVRLMNNIKASAEEIVLKNMIYV